MASRSEEQSRTIAEIATLTEMIATTGHVGRRNRLMGLQSRLFDEIGDGAEARAVFLMLLAHAQASVRMAAAWHCGWRRIVFEETERAVTRLTERDDQIGAEAKRWLERREQMASGYKWQKPSPKKIEYAPAPAGCPRSVVVELMKRSLSKTRLRQLSPLLSRAIRLWPRADTGDPYASRFGGLPVLPPDYGWPCFNDEPMLFLGQINCAEVHTAIGDNPFPKRGMIQFYGDHDEVTGCGPDEGSAVFYFQDVEALHPTPAPIENFLELGRCGLDFYETAELPDSRSEAVEHLSLSVAEKDAYRDLTREIAELAGAGLFCDRPSKLLGWPDLIQRDLGWDCGRANAGSELLLQIGWYHDGAEGQSWGPGGLVYFVLDRKAIVEGRFESAAMEMQCS